MVASNGSGGELVRKADAAQYERPPISESERGKITVRLLNATPDPLGSVAALCEQYKGNVIRDLSDVTDEQRRACLSDMGKTVLNGPLEAVQFHWQIEGVTRSITHQMVRSRASFFAQESLRFAVPTGDWAEEIPLPPSLSRSKGGGALGAESSQLEYARNLWDENMRNTARTYEGLIEAGVPAEEARGVLPHDMPTRLHWVCDLRTMLAEAGKRTCTQAQFPWRLIFAGMAKALREKANEPSELQGWTVGGPDAWQFEAIAAALRPVCFQTGKCGFMAEFDRSCSIRARVDTFSELGVPSAEWNDFNRFPTGAINNAEWAANPGAARS